MKKAKPSRPVENCCGGCDLGVERVLELEDDPGLQHRKLGSSAQL